MIPAPTRIYSVIESDTFSEWVARLRDDRAQALITKRLERVVLGHLGEAKSVGGGVYEMRIHYGPGYRLYYTRRGEKVIFLLCGGDKSSQARDIQTAKKIAQSL